MRRFPLSQRCWPTTALAVGLVSSLLAWRLTMEFVGRQEAERFDFRAREWVSAVSHAVVSHEHLLYGAAGLFAASEDVTRDEWRTYTSMMRHGKPFASGQEFGFAQRLAPEDLATHIQQIRDEGLPAYTVWPEGARSEYTPCVYLEPFEELNRHEFGFDLSSEPVRRAALERARDTGRATLSGKVDLVREGEPGVQSGFLMIVPVYRTGMPVGTVGERRSAVYGYVFSSFRAKDFLCKIFSAGLSFTHLQVFDGRETTAESLLVDGLQPEGARSPEGRELVHLAVVELAGRSWTLRFIAKPGFASQADLSLPWVVLAGGIILSLFFGLIVWDEQRILAKARQLQLSEAQLATTLNGIRNLNENLEQRVSERTAELARATEDWERTFDAVPDMIAIISDDFQIVRANRALAERLGLTPRDLLGQRCYACVHGTHEPPPLCPHQRLLDDGQPHVVEMVVPQLGGFMEIQDTPLRDKAGRLIGTVHVIRDINQRELARQALQEANASLDRRVTERTRDLEIARAEAEAASRAKSAFLSSMSHEIRTPMNAILGFAQILEHDSTLTARQAEQVQTITRSGRHLLLLLNDILDMSRIESGQLSLSVTDFSLHDLLTDLEMMFRPRAVAKGLQFIVERQDNLVRYVTADKGKLRQVLVNLIGNAVKFTEAGRVVVRIRTDAAAAGASPDDSENLHLLVEVEDTGPGIPDQDKALIFESFRQAEAGKKAGGTGLGLAISKRLVEMLGGVITVQSTVGKGSCFRVQVPVKRAEGVTDKPIRAPRRVVGLEPGTGPVRILEADGVDETPRDTAGGWTLSREDLAALPEELVRAMRQAVEAHGGKMGVQSEVGKGSVFWFTIPPQTEGA